MAEFKCSDADARRTGVYCIKNVANGKVYVGSASQSFHIRCNRHLRELRQGKHHCQYLQNAYNKHGEAAFEFHVLESCDPQVCVQQERVWIETLKAIDPEHGYNLLPAADSALGIKRSAETKAKIAASKVGKPRSAETREKLRVANRGKRASDETRRKMSETRNGQKRGPFSEEHRANMSRSRKGKPSPNRGKKMSQERIEKTASKLRGRKLSQKHRDKVSKALSERVWTDQARKNQSEAQKARGWSPSAEQRAEISKRHKGKKLTPEAIAKREATRRRNRILASVSGDSN